MDTITKRYIWLFFAVLMALMVGAYVINTTYSPQRKPQPSNDLNSHRASYVTIRDTEGKVILETGIPVYEQDEYISENNLHYVIISISGSNAVARKKDMEKSELNPVSQKLSAASISYPHTVEAQALLNPHHVVIYHTHTDESYVPDSSRPDKPGDGDIFQVGAALADSLSKAGISVHHSYNPHDPHDINAYHRSRRTLTQLLQERPDAAFDIHRDSAPLGSYSTTVNGVDTARVMIVIGRSNPNMSPNLNFARIIKDAADDLHPGLMRGIYMGRGDYNQDLYPTSLIFEVGTESNSLDAAQKAVRCLADAIIAVVGT
ncbi:MAG: stage II sporulation protein P [Syntrophomonas sp.]|uniref:stage II sporulation protein P n=1 Tax=Syntrophomonas sp. TaxID=2053627 RepID=UPI002625781B|nr:stage II sporulation protein P [Syntrophomonas sp.]MDD2509751.1 stage II sporulation protein P [Syntrophomonas sp.]MDD3880012.1 stage II sporulation protein P [Syntrophomonas sp.]MDD4625756.1 stage II sporulation protein P [Syntrophomonas sp.]